MKKFNIKSREHKSGQTHLDPEEFKLRLSLFKEDSKSIDNLSVVGTSVLASTAQAESEMISLLGDDLIVIKSE